MGGDQLADVSEQTQNEIEAIAHDIERQIAEKQAEIDAMSQRLSEAEANAGQARNEGEAATIAALKSRLQIF